MKRALRWKLLDNYKRKLFLKNEIRRIMLQFVIKNTYTPQSYRYFALYQKSKVTRLKSSVQHKNRCVSTGRVWAVNRMSNLSRFVFQREAYKGHLPGFKRASW